VFRNITNEIVSKSYKIDEYKACAATGRQQFESIPAVKMTITFTFMFVAPCIVI